MSGHSLTFTIESCPTARAGTYRVAPCDSLAKEDLARHITGNSAKNATATGISCAAERLHITEILSSCYRDSKAVSCGTAAPVFGTLDRLPSDTAIINLALAAEGARLVEAMRKGWAA